MSQVEIDLSATRVESIDVHGGMSQVALTLSRPQGEASVRILGGASKLTIRRPQDVATRVRIAGGASALVLDGRRYGAMGGPQELSTPGFDAAGDRYDVEIHGGASKLTVEAYPAAELAMSA